MVNGLSGCETSLAAATTRRALGGRPPSTRCRRASGHAVAVAQLGPGLPIEGHETDLVGPEAAVRLARLIARRPAVQPFGLEDAGDGITVQMRPEGGDPEGEIVERKARRAA